MNENSDKNDKIENGKKNIEVVSGDGSNIDISPVYESINSVRPKSKEDKPKDIVIPKPKK